MKNKKGNFLKGHIPWNKGISTGIKYWLGKKRSEKTKIKISAANKGKRAWNKHKKMATIISNYVNPNKGKIATEETRQKIKEGKRKNPGKGFTGNHHSVKTRKILQNKSIGLWASPNSVFNTVGYRKKLSIATTGSKNPFYGKKHTKKTRKILKNCRLLQIFPNKDTKPEKIVQNELLKRNIQFKKHVPLIGQPDIFIEPNICIFVDGDYVHGNPKEYKSTDLLMNRKPAKVKWKYDKTVTRKLKYRKYVVLRFWEMDIYKNINLIINKIESLLVKK